MPTPVSEREPGDLLLVRDFVNTRELEEDRDELSSPEGLRAWLAGRGLLEAERVSAEEVARAVEVREALRALLRANNGAEADVAAAAATIDAAARRARLELRFRPAAEAEPEAGGADGAIGRLLAIVAAAMADGRWPRLKACRSETCAWAFYDSARNASRTWCSMQVCGNRQKARTYRARRSGAGA
jgi:predicted RNA-binding Zn ribbon-like protein